MNNRVVCSFGRSRMVWFKGFVVWLRFLGLVRVLIIVG